MSPPGCPLIAPRSWCSPSGAGETDWACRAVAEARGSPRPWAEASGLAVPRGSRVEADAPAPVGSLGDLGLERFALGEA